MKICRYREKNYTVEATRFWLPLSHPVDCTLDVGGCYNFIICSGDWIVLGPAGELYTCTDEAFVRRFELFIEDNDS